jgi:hypothetical protein
MRRSGGSETGPEQRFVLKWTRMREELPRLQVMPAAGGSGTRLSRQR